MKNVWKNKLLCLLLLMAFISARLHAQELFRYRADLEQVPQDGFYQIRLDLSLLVHSQDGLWDIRIVDQQNSFVPYLRRTGGPETKESFLPFQILRNQPQNDTTSSLIVENSQSGPLRTLWLNLKNANVQRTADLLGSNDLKNWYALEEGILFNNTFSVNRDNHFQSLTFPATSYRYLQLLIYNKQKSPLHILQAGVFKQEQQHARLIPLPKGSLTRRDSSDQRTYIRLRYPRSYQIDQLSLKISSPKYFKRRVEVFQGSKEGRLFVSGGVLQSPGPHVISFDLRNHELELVIENGDNPTLRIQEIAVLQRPRYLLAYLEKGKSYALLTGYPKAAPPKYDLEYFTDSAVAKAADLKHFALASNPQYRPAEAPAVNSNYFLWPAIVLALGSLIWLIKGLLKGIEERGKG